MYARDQTCLKSEAYISLLIAFGNRKAKTAIFFGSLRDIHYLCVL